MKGDRIQSLLIAGEMIYSLVVRKRGAGLQESSRRYAFQLIKRPHLRAILQRPVIVDVDGIPFERRIGGIPPLAQIFCSAVYFIHDDGEYLIFCVIAAQCLWRMRRRDTQLAPAFPIGLKEQPLVAML